VSRDETGAPLTSVPSTVDDPWTLVYEGFDAGAEGLREALCALGNGRFVTRGAAEESAADEVHYPGTYVGGGYNQLVSTVAGREVVNEDLVNLPNWLPLTFRPEDGEWFALDAVELLEYRQELRMREGVLWRRLRVRDARGRETVVESRRIVHMRAPHLAAIEYRITPRNWSGGVRIRSTLDGSVVNHGVPRYRDLAHRHLEPVDAGSVRPEGIHLLVRTSQSHLEFALAARTRLFVDDRLVEGARCVAGEGTAEIGEEIATRLDEGVTLRVEKVVALHTSRDRGITHAGVDARLAIGRAPDFDRLLATHRIAWDALWHEYDVLIEGVEDGWEALLREQMILRLHIFHLLQTVSPNTIGLDVAAPARGLHGEAYRGHIFWDELFILPMYDLRTPAITRSLLLYRYHRLEAARELARGAGYRGAMFPWQSSSDGQETTQEVHLNPLSGAWDPDHSRLQRHVNAAIVYNVWKYYLATGDRDFLVRYGAEMVLEIARFWASAATPAADGERFEIVGVMGPDEYHEGYPAAAAGGVRNNAYTNVMAVWCLLRAFEVLDAVGDRRAAVLRALLELHPDELDRWRAITRRMTIPFHGDGIISQFEGYESLEPFDWEGYRERYGNIERLDRILKAEGDSPDRYQLSKQADLNMLFFLLEPREIGALFERLGHAFDVAAMERNVRYYMERTSHGSTLSKTVFASVLHRLDSDAGVELFLEALRSDIDDVQGGTTREGIHLGAMAGTVGIVFERYAGVSLELDRVRLEPRLPRRLRRVCFRIHHRGRWLHVDLTTGRLRVTLDADLPQPVLVEVHGAEHHLAAGSTLDVAL
jgi:alpha,alpha-trehalase